MATSTIEQDSPHGWQEHRHCTAATDVTSQLAAARAAQAIWRQTSVKSRLRVIRAFRHAIAEHCQVLVDAISYPGRNGPAETLAAEVLPLAEACKFLEREAKAILAPRRLCRRHRPLWLPGVAVELRREPWGVVLVVGASNYPLLLTGVQTLQAVAAGNAVLIKPGRGSSAAAHALRDLFIQAGLEPALVQILSEDTRSVEMAVEAGVDKVVLTGSAETGRHVQSLLSHKLTPATMELSGCDAVFVLEGADLDRVARCIAFGLRLNTSATCIAPRRVFVPHHLQAELEKRIRDELARAQDAPVTPCSAKVAQLVQESLDCGARVVAGGVTGGGMVDRDAVTLAGPTVLGDANARMPLLQADVFAPITSLVPVSSVIEALQANDQCPYALGATVFGPEAPARVVAEKVNAGCVVINDLIAPTADPRVPFGGRKQSGFGMTRGAAGLEDMTQIKAIVEQRGRWLPHLQEPSPGDAALLTACLKTLHGRGWQRWQNAWTMLRSAIERVKWQRSRNS